MKLSFGQSLYDRRATEPWGIPQEVNWCFDYMHQHYMIPKIFYFEEGISFDVFNILDTDKIKAFISKHKSYVDAIDEEAYICLQAENPIPELSLNKAFINNKAVEIAGASSNVYIACSEDEGSPQLKEIYCCYEFLNVKDVSFQVNRIHLKCLDNTNKINEIKLIPQSCKALLQVKKHFTVAVDLKTAQQEISFNHPITGITHRLLLNDTTEFDTSSIGINNNIPYYILMLHYEVLPPLAENEALCIKDILVKLKDGSIHTSYDTPSPAIAVLTEKKKGNSGYPLEQAVSKPYLSPIDYATFSIVGIEKEELQEDIIIKSEE